MKLRVVGMGEYVNFFRSHRSMYLQGIDTLGKAALDKSLLVVYGSSSDKSLSIMLVALKTAEECLYHARMAEISQASRNSKLLRYIFRELAVNETIPRPGRG
jgi:hypothetical protein